MKKSLLLATALLASYTLSTSYADPINAALVTAGKQSQLTPDKVLARLKAGNERFRDGKQVQKDYIKKAELTAKKGQHPAAIILSCIDSRVPPEIIFDQGVGNMFVTRIAANEVDDDVLGGMEFATKAAGARLVVVMGHDACGAVHGACDGVKMGNLTQLLAKVQPAVKQVTKRHDGKKQCDDPAFVDEIAKQNVKNVVAEIRKNSPILAGLEKDGKIKIVGAMYHLPTGQVEFFDESADS